jgi:cobalt-zinc-cadmium efflux system outer membrane protein
MMRHALLLLCFLAVIATTGCTVPRRDVALPERRPLGREIAIYEASSDSRKASALTITEPDGELTLRNALALALMHNPKLAATSWNVRIGEARRLQAGLLPNPEVEFEAEEVAGSGGRDGFDTAEMSIHLSQLIELGGKRSTRTRVAEIEGRLAGWDHEAERLAVLTDATLGFIDVLSAQAQLQLAQELASLSEKTLAAVIERVSAGKVSPLEKIKAEVELANNKIEQQKAESKLRSARKRLVSVWGSFTPRFSKAVGVMDRIEDVPAYEGIQALLAQNPNIARWAEEMEQRLAALALERARRVPDLTVGVGVQRFEETNDHALTFGISLPLPLFDRNQGGVLEARYRLAQAGHERKSAEIRTAVALAESYEALTAARTEVIGLKDQVVPAAVKAFDAANEGYRQGKFGYLEVLDAQRTLFEARSRLLDSQARYHRSVAIVESLIGAKLESLQDRERKER